MSEYQKSYNGREITAKEGRKFQGLSFGRKTLGSREYRRKLERLTKRQERKQNDN
tara:strand:- start:498 stop:662 length:165 start_codon:yes stop_codon:yes gene_type:complete